MTRGQYYVALVVLAVSGLAGGVLGTWLFSEQSAFAQEAVADVVSAREFQLLDEEGRRRGLFSLIAAGTPALYLYDADGNKCVALGIAGGNPILVLQAGDGTGGSVDISTILGKPSLALYDAAGEKRGSFGINTDGRPSLDLYDADGVTRAVVGTTNTVNTRTGAQQKFPESTVTLFNAESTVLWQAP